jgi:hypothetical protein
MLRTFHEGGKVAYSNMEVQFVYDTLVVGKFGDTPPTPQFDGRALDGNWLKYATNPHDYPGYVWLWIPKEESEYWVISKFNQEQESASISYPTMDPPPEYPNPEDSYLRPNSPPDKYSY